jgi:hypothetical protein
MQEKLHSIVEILDEFGLMGQPIGKRMALVATMGSTLRPKDVYIVHEELTDLIAHELKVVMYIGGWLLHIRECADKYDATWFSVVANCDAFYYNYFMFYSKVQQLAEKECNGVRIK